MTILDAKDTTILARKAARLNAVPNGPRVGDFIEFSNGRFERVSRAYDAGIQTSRVDQGSWFLGEGACSFSGSLNPGIDRARLQTTPRTQPGRVWFFGHDDVRAHNRVDAEIDFRVFVCSG